MDRMATISFEDYASLYPATNAVSKAISNFETAVSSASCNAELIAKTATQSLLNTKDLIVEKEGEYCPAVW